MNTDKRIIRNIETLGRRFEKKYLARYDLKVLMTDSWKALEFYFDHAFMRGRGNELSTRYETHTWNVLERLLFDDSGRSWLDRLSDFQIDLDDKAVNNYLTNASKFCSCAESGASRSPAGLLNSLTPHMRSHSRKFLVSNPDSLPLNVPTDLRMVASSLKFILENTTDGNIFSFIVREIAAHGVLATKNKLMTIKGVKDKIAPFLLQDIVLLHKDDSSFPIDANSTAIDHLVPIDTWVVQVARQTGFREQSKGERDSNYFAAVRRYFINLARITGLNPLLIAGGLWFTGFHSLELLVECLGLVDLPELPAPTGSKEGKKND